MRTVTYGAACSLDGFIAGVDGAVDWLHFSRDAQQVMADYWKTIDTILMGRRTFDEAVKRNEGKGGGGGGGFPGVSTYLFSRTLATSPDPSVGLVRDDAVGFVRDLKNQPGKGICVMGGGDLASALLEGGVVDEVGVNIHPVVLGGGTPLFRSFDRRIPLELAECRTLEGGCVYATYRVRN